MRIMIVLIALLISSTGLAGTVPKYFNYQALLTDDGGNSLPDGTTGIHIRLFDAQMVLIYEEDQNVDVKSGVVSIMVGAGAGGIGSSSLLAEGPKYLEVQADGYSPEDLMEIAAVPYSAVADIAMGVADGSIRMSHLSDEVLNELGEKLVGGAGNVVVTPDFTYSSAENVQGVLRDLDLSIKKRSEEITRVQSSTQTYITQQTANNSDLWNALNAHAVNLNNPHAVTSAQIGAVATSALFDQNGKINDALIPANIVREPELPSENPPVPVAYMHVVCAGAAPSACSILAASPDCSFTSAGGLSPSDSYVTCVLAKQNVGQLEQCNMKIDGEIIPEYSVKTGAFLSAKEFGTSVRRYLSNNDGDGDWGTFGCREIVEFKIAGGLSGGDELNLVFYKRSLF